MPFASIAGVTYQMQNPGATEIEPEPIGQVRRMFAGGARNSVRTQARGWSMTSLPILEADFTILYNNVKNRKFVTCDGDFLDLTPTLCWVQITNSQYFKPFASAPLMRIVSLEIHEVAPAVSIFTPSVYRFLLTSVVSPDDATAFVSTPDGSYPGDAGSGMTLGAGLVPPTAACPTVPGVVISATPEAKHLSVPLDNGFAFGKPAIQFETGTMNNGVWNFGDISAKLSLIRSSATVAGPWTSTWVPMGGLGSYLATLAFANSISVTLIAGDQFLIEWYARIGLDCGQADNAERPFAYIGAVPGPRTSPALILSGQITSL